MFILQNQDGYFLSKSGEWVDGRSNNLLFRTPNKDEAVNQMFEINSQDFSLRINLMECETNAKNLPIIPPELLPPPIIPFLEGETIEASELGSDANEQLFDSNDNEDRFIPSTRSQSA